MYAVKSLFFSMQGEGAHAGRTAVFCRFAGCNLWNGREADRASAQCRFCDTDFVGTDGPGGGKFADAETLARAARRVWEAAELPVCPQIGPAPEAGAVRRNHSLVDSRSSTPKVFPPPAQGRSPRAHPGTPAATDVEPHRGSRRIDASFAETLSGFAACDVCTQGAPEAGDPGLAAETPSALKTVEDGTISTFSRSRPRPYLVMTGGEPTLQLDAELVAACQQLGFEVAIETNGTRPLPAGLDWVCVSPKAGTELAVRGGDELKLVFPQANAEPARFEGLAFRHFFLQPCDGPDLARNRRLAAEHCLRNPRWRLSLQTHKLLGLP